MEEPQNLIGKRRDWSHLPTDLVDLIAKKLPDLLDYIHVHFTCTSWRSSTSLSDFQVRFPWLLEFHQKPDDFISVPTTRLRLYSISSEETFTIPVKESSWYKGSSNNYLPFIDNHTGTISLFNPLTNDEFATPLVHDPSKPFSSYMVGTESGPICDRRILIIYYEGSLSGVDRWTIYDPRNNRWREQDGLCVRYCYCQGLFFHSTYATHETEVFDLSKNLLYTIPPHEDDIMDALTAKRSPLYCLVFKSYVVVSSREIWRVHWYYDANILTTWFKIYRLHFEEEARQPCWVKIRDIGDEVVFLEMTNGIVNGSSVTASTNGLRGGQIYFIDPYNRKPYVYDFVSGMVAAVPCPFEKCTWFVPGLG